MLLPLLAVLGASPVVQSDLDRAASAFERMDFPAARTAIDRASAAPSLTTEQKVRIALYSGLVSAYTNDASAARAAFRRALSLDPLAMLPVKVSPKVDALFAEAKGVSASSVGTSRIAFFDFEANGATKEGAAAATGAVAHELERIGLFSVITADGLKALLSLERQKQLLGCSEGQSQCLSELAGALGVDYLVSGKLSRIPGRAGEAPSVTLELQLLDVLHAKRVSSAIATASSEREAVSGAEATAGKLLAPLLAAHKGDADVECSERGAEVKVDGTLLGTTPLPSALAIPAGAHRLEVTKDGFVAFSTEVRISANQKTSVVARLEPSPDFVASYRSRESKLRAGAWISTGLAVVGAGGAAYFGWQSKRLYGSSSTPGTFQFDKAMLASGVEADSGGDYRTGANTLKARIQSANTAGYVCAGVAAAAAVAAVTFWIVGDDPGRYSTSVALSPSGVTVGGTF